MEFTKEQVEMFKDDAESAPFKHGYDVLIIGLCADWLKMNTRETIVWHKYPEEKPKTNGSYLLQVGGHKFGWEIFVADWDGIGTQRSMFRFRGSNVRIEYGINAWAEMPKGIHATP